MPALVFDDPSACLLQHVGDVALVAQLRKLPLQPRRQTSEHALEVGTERLSSVVDKSDPHLVLHTCVRGPHAR
jgi:hypothetical protein